RHTEKPVVPASPHKKPVGPWAPRSPSPSSIILSAMSRSAPLGAPTEAHNVLAITSFRRLWISLSLSSLGDWLSLMSLTSLVLILPADASARIGYLVVAAIIAIRLRPLIVGTPMVRWVAGRLDRWWTMVVGAVRPGLLFVYSPVGGLLRSGFPQRWL